MFKKNPYIYVTANAAKTYIKSVSYSVSPKKKAYKYLIKRL